MGKYLDNRLKYHTASRIGAQTGYSLAQALDPDGHIVRYDSVWVAPTTAFPMNVSKTTDPKDATDDLIEVFTGSKTPTAAGATLGDGVTVRESIGTGKVYRNSNYPAVELFYQVPMTGVANSDGADSKGKYQAYEIQENSKRVMDWVAPTAVINPDTTKPVAGFSGIAEANVGGTWTVLQKVPKWALATGTWEFAYISGILTFDPNAVPGDSGAASSVRFTGFKYIGDTADDKFTTMEGSISGKVDTATYTTKIGELEGDINNKVDTTEYTTKIGELEGDINGKVDTTEYTTKIGELEGDIEGKVDTDTYTAKIGELEGDINDKVDTDTYTAKIGELEGKINNIQFTWDEEPEVPAVSEVSQFTISKVTLLSGTDTYGMVANLTGKSFTQGTGGFVEVQSDSTTQYTLSIVDGKAPSIVDGGYMSAAISCSSASDNPFDPATVWSAMDESTYQLEFTFA